MSISLRLLLLGPWVSFAYVNLPAHAQQTAVAAPEPVYRSVAECPHMPGLMVMIYDRRSGSRRTDLEFSELCLDPSGPSVQSGEPISGLTLVQDFGGGTVQYQIVTPGSRDHERTTLSISPKMSLIDGDAVTLAEAAAWDVQAQYFGSPALSHPDADNHSGYGYAYWTLEDDASFPGGEWLLHFVVKIVPDLTRPDVLDRTIMGTHAVAGVTFDGTRPTSTEFLRSTPLMPAPVDAASLELAIVGGRISAGLTFEMANARLPAGRTENEWTTARIEAPYVKGHVTKGASELQMHALGIGRIVVSDDLGREDVEHVYVTMFGTRLPDGATAAKYLEGQ